MIYDLKKQVAFQKSVISKLEEFTYKSKELSHRKNKKFKKWFIAQTKKQLNWNITQAENELNKIYLTLNIKIKNHGSSNSTRKNISS